MRLKLGALLSCAAWAAASTINGESEHSTFKVTMPASLKNAFPDGLRHSQALFGSPTYGGDKKITGPLVYATPKPMETACDTYEIEAPSNSDPDQRPIFLVDRGACDFVQKMRIAQAKGAVAVIIADNVCQCDWMQGYAVDLSIGHTAKLLDTCKSLGARSPTLLPGEVCEDGLPYMADDGTGDDIRIPSFLIDFIDAQALKDCWFSSVGDIPSDGLITGDAFKCAKNSKIVVQLAWDLPVTGDQVRFELWSSSDSEALFKREFGPLMPKLAPYIMFQPRYFVWDGAYWGCTINNLCSTQCTDRGFYCNPDPDNDRYAGVAGVDVVNENLREMCVWDKAWETYDEDGGVLWWEYVKLFAQNCHPGAMPDAALFNEACSQKVHGMIPGLNWETTQACVQKSWSDGKGAGHNVLLDKELQDRKNLKILTLPTAIINGDIIRGGLNAQVVVMAVCAGFAPDKKPPICACVSGVSPGNVVDCMQSGCAAGQLMCIKDKKCYPEAELYKQCALQCSSSETWCDSTSKCTKPGEPCPACADPAKPRFCPLLTTCVADVYACRPPQEDVPANSGSGGGLTVAGGLALIIVGSAFMGGVFFALWRRQRARLQDDVRAILSTYMPLEELDARGGVSTQAPLRTPAGNAQVEPAPLAGGRADASQLI